MSDVAKHVAEVSESRSEGLSTQRFSEEVRSGLRRKETKMTDYSRPGLKFVRLCILNKVAESLNN